MIKNPFKKSADVACSEPDADDVNEKSQKPVKKPMIPASFSKLVKKKQSLKKG